MEINNNLPPSKSTLPHSRLGIAGFVAGLLAICILVSYLVFIFVVVMNAWSNLSLYSKAPAVLPYVLCSTSLLSLITLILGVIPLFQKQYKKLFAILAIVEWIISILL